MMKFDFNRMLFALSYALDCIEHDLLGVTTNHGKRVAAITINLSDYMNVLNSEEERKALAACAVMHDSALTEYVQDEFDGSYVSAAEASFNNVGRHCIIGEESMRFMPFNKKVMEKAVLYHHENADGSGPLGKKTDELPISARLIHIADTVDARFDLSWISSEKKATIITFVKDNTGNLFDSTEADAFLKLLSEMDLRYLRNEKIDIYLESLLPGGITECSSKELMDFASVFARIVDYKSHFTKTHSIGIAGKAYEIAGFYDVPEELAAKLYFAGALHDIGKLVVDRDVLEKPAKLNASEYKHIQTHAYYTYKILSDIPGIEDITRWASYHHEKLDGTGYPFGLKAKELGRWERLMACLDIYQALTEERPYKKGMSHEEAIEILGKLCDSGKLDRDITDDIDIYFRLHAK